MISKEMIEDAASESANDSNPVWIITEQDSKFDANHQSRMGHFLGFEKGAEWAIKQMSNDAIEFAQWIYSGDWYYIKERNYWVTGNGIDELESKQFHPRITLTSQQLYQLYLNNNKK